MKRKSAKGSMTARTLKRSAQVALATATNSKRSTTKRVAAFAQAPLAACESDRNLQGMLKVLRDQNEPVEVRLAALQSLQTASFSVVAFESCRGDYIAELRKVAEDPDSELRQRALGFLAREKDGFAQKKLIEGLQNPGKALVPPEKALQLLSYDVHAEAYQVARSIVTKPPNDAARREALRLLAADATSAPLFEKVLRDKREAFDIRQISASALQALRPEKLQKHARAMLLDTSEDDKIQATSLTALTEFGNDAAIGRDDALLESINRLSGQGSTMVKKCARRLLRKHGGYKDGAP